MTLSTLKGNVLSVTDFGADPTGAVDSTAAINAAYATLKGNTGTVIFPPGVYTISNTINCGDFNGGAGAQASFISTEGSALSPGTTIISWHGPNSTVCFNIAFNKYFHFTGINISNANSSTGVVGIQHSGAGAGGPTGNTVLSGIFDTVTVGGFNVGHQASGNNGTSSEMTYINCSFLGCNTGWVTNDFNGLDHTFINCSFSGNGYDIDTGASESVHVFGGSTSNPTIAAFRVQQIGFVDVTGFRGEASQFALGINGSVYMRNCHIRNCPNKIAVSGPFNDFIAESCVFEGFINLTSANSVYIHGCAVYPDPSTCLPFSIPGNTYASGQPTAVSCIDNHDNLSSQVPMHDVQGCLKGADNTGTGPLFGNIGMLYSTVAKIRTIQTTANLQIPLQYGIDYQALHHVRSLGEGPIPGTTDTPAQYMSLVTNAATLAGSNVLHFASVPIGTGGTSGTTYPAPGMSVQDNTHTTVIPFGAYVTGVTSTTVLLNTNVTGAGVISGDTIGFFPGIVATTPAQTTGQNLRIQGTFATSATLALTFTRTLTFNTGGGPNAIWTANTGAFQKSDVGKLLKVAGAGTAGWTDWYGVCTTFISSTQIIASAGTPQVPLSIPAASPKTATIGANEPDANYMVIVQGISGETYGVSSITNTGFTITSSNASSTATVTCLIIR